MRRFVYASCLGVALLACETTSLNGGSAPGMSPFDGLKLSDEIRASGARVFQLAAPSVVFVLTEDAFGSGALIDDRGSVITNWHVVERNSHVRIIYKPDDLESALESAEIYRAEVVKVDEIADLALLRIKEPRTGTRALKIDRSSNIEVASVVHAIGHPTGEAWTYTHGYVSQLRNAYEWQVRSGHTHRADVIQTQTPINPGNSGGPLLNNAGELVGLNTFVADGEGLNFAVRSTEIRRFLDRAESRFQNESPTSRASEIGSFCEERILREERIEDPAGVLISRDIDCDGAEDGILIIPDDPNSAAYGEIDHDRDGIVDQITLDEDRDGKVDKTLYDTDQDGEPDVVGFHLDGETEPYMYEEIPTYQP